MSLTKRYYDDAGLSASEVDGAEDERIDQAEWDQWCLESAARQVNFTAAELDEFDRAMGLGRLVDLANDFAGRKAA